MTPTEVIALITAILALIGGMELRIKALTKHYLDELKPNSGSSLRDEVKAIHAQVDTILKIINKSI